ncbi:uncharacterized protein BKA55DRAFT_737980 [Fusarium redolens]|uniref:Uncharacterized protein n=1 Tax=Fusarium redolens TaxID=48865 RepID=A0A9P9HB09_FUSRE|nr:uncharacterized protein BKA55DRAFT_737980 [Fusarium redolens]KAH7254268.1 hypothetical protein BKA55DRAFT_737980 [Fusarium redolens]
MATAMQLQAQLPSVTSASDVGHNTSGLDCLLVVIRHIYSHMPSEYLDKVNNISNREGQAKNPILKLGWLDIDETHPEVHKEWVQAKKDAIHAFKGDVSHSARFDELAASKVMTDTIWSTPEFRIVIHGHAAISEKLLLTVNRRQTPGISFQEHIDLNFQSFAPRISVNVRSLPALVDTPAVVFNIPSEPPASRRTQVALRSDTPPVGFSIPSEPPAARRTEMTARPAVIRVIYSTQKDQTPFAFSTLKEMAVPVHEAYSSSGLCLYKLFAAVNMATDQVKTYDYLGECRMSWPKSEGKQWSLKDKVDGQFMLLYACSYK